MELGPKPGIRGHDGGGGGRRLRAAPRPPGPSAHAAQERRTARRGAGGGRACVPGLPERRREVGARRARAATLAADVALRASGAGRGFLTSGTWICAALGSGLLHQNVQHLQQVQFEQFNKTSEALRKGTVKTHGLRVQTFFFCFGYCSVSSVKEWALSSKWFSNV